MKLMEKLRLKAKIIKQDVMAVYWACRDPGCPWYAKVVAGLVVAYALSPIDLIPDFIPVLGYLDDIILVPLGILLVVRMIPGDVMERAREKAAGMEKKKGSLLGLFLVIVAWLAVAVIVGKMVWKNR